MQATKTKAFKSPLRFAPILARVGAGALALQPLGIFAIITLLDGDAPNSFTPTDKARILSPMSSSSAAACSPSL